MGTKNTESLESNSDPINKKSQPLDLGKKVQRNQQVGYVQHEFGEASHQQLSYSNVLSKGQS